MSGVRESSSKKCHNYQYSRMKWRNAAHSHSLRHSGHLSDEASSKDVLMGENSALNKQNSPEHYELEEGEFVPNSEDFAVGLKEDVHGDVIKEEKRDTENYRKLDSSRMTKLPLKGNNVINGEKGKPLLTNYTEIIKEDAKASNTSANPAHKAIKRGETVEDFGNKRWNLRDRKYCQLPKHTSPFLSAGLQSSSIEANLKMASLNNGKGKIEKEENEGFPKLPKFTLALKPEEIAQDLFIMTGKMPSRKVNKRPKHIQRQIDLICPGGKLESITMDSYKVCGSSKKAK